MTFPQAIDAFIRDMWLVGRINSEGTERAYRDALYRHMNDVHAADRNWLTSDRLAVKATLGRWRNPNTIKGRLAALVSFYDWTMREGHRKDNPARQVDRPRKRKPNVYRLSRSEVGAMLAAANSKYETRIVTLGICAGLRNAELRGLRGRHFARAGFVWVSEDIAKGGRERWVPVILEAVAVVEEIRKTVGADEYALPSLTILTGRDVVSGQWSASRIGHREDPSKPCSSQHILRTVGHVADKAGIRAHIYPHLMRHAYADHVSRYSGVKAAQALLGHADISTTQAYLDTPTIDELAMAVDGFGFTLGAERAANPLMRPAGFEPALSDIRAVEPNHRLAVASLATVLLRLEGAFRPMVVAS